MRNEHVDQVEAVQLLALAAPLLAAVLAARAAPSVDPLPALTAGLVVALGLGLILLVLRMLAIATR